LACADFAKKTSFELFQHLVLNKKFFASLDFFSLVNMKWLYDIFPTRNFAKSLGVSPEILSHWNDFLFSFDSRKQSCSNNTKRIISNG